ncbi:MAG: carboxylesterase family protein, partial [Lachnospiraceae bacterium]|nr:carboxylesterase family protein [Lachnospiraceae bacterium]
MGLKLSNVPQLFADGYVIPSEGFDVISTGNYNAVPILFGSSSQEFSTYALSANYYDAELNSKVIKKGWSMISLIQNAKKYGSMYQSYYYIEHNTEKFVSSGIQPPMYAYRFDWGNDNDEVSDFHAQFLGSYHGLDVNFLCGTYKNEYENYVTKLYTNDNAAGRKALTAVMQSYIGNFLRTGNPNGKGLSTWNPWTTNQNMKVMVFDASEDDNASYMSSMYYSRTYIDNLMQQALSDAQCKLLKNCVFAGRYFMPDDNTTSVPDDEADDIVEDPVETNNSEL